MCPALGLSPLPPRTLQYVFDLIRAKLTELRTQFRHEPSMLMRIEMLMDDVGLAEYLVGTPYDEAVLEVVSFIVYYMSVNGPYFETFVLGPPDTCSIMGYRNTEEFNANIKTRFTMKGLRNITEKWRQILESGYPMLQDEFYSR